MRFFTGVYLVFCKNLREMGTLIIMSLTFPINRLPALRPRGLIFEVCTGDAKRRASSYKEARRRQID